MSNKMQNEIILKNLYTMFQLTPSKLALTTVSNILWQCVRYIIMNVSTCEQKVIMLIVIIYN